jgi:hypothetical protein
LRKSKNNQTQFIY